MESALAQRRCEPCLHELSTFSPACAAARTARQLHTKSTPPRGEQVHTFDYVNMAICKTVAHRAKSAPYITGCCLRTHSAGLAMCPAARARPPRRPRAAALAHTSRTLQRRYWCHSGGNGHAVEGAPHHRCCAYQQPRCCDHHLEADGENILHQAAEIWPDLVYRARRRRG